jgi:hypothetical protein
MRVALTGLLALFLLSCGDTDDGRSLAAAWPPECPAIRGRYARIEHAALIAEASRRGLAVERSKAEAYKRGIEADMEGIGNADYVEGAASPVFGTDEALLYHSWMTLLLEKIRAQEGLEASNPSEAFWQRLHLLDRLVAERATREGG